MNGYKRLIFSLLALGAVPILIPFAWMLSTSLKTRENAAEYPPTWVPVQDRLFVMRDGRKVEVTQISSRLDGTIRVLMPNGEMENVHRTGLTRERVAAPQWSNYKEVVAPTKVGADENFSRFLLNTLLIAGMTVLGQALTCSLVGWGFARMRFVGKNALFMIMLATTMLPSQVSMIPTFMIYRQLGWVDTFLPLIVPAWTGGAFFSFLYRQYFMGIPVEMDEAATMDGCSPLRTFWWVLLPMAKPVTVTVSVYAFLGAWNDFLGPLLYLNSDHKRTLSLALARFQGAYSSDIPMMMAAATLMLIPVLLIYFFSQRALMQGMMVSGVKG